MPLFNANTLGLVMLQEHSLDMRLPTNHCPICDTDLIPKNIQIINCDQIVKDSDPPVTVRGSLSKYNLLPYGYTVYERYVHFYRIALRRFNNFQSVFLSGKYYEHSILHTNYILDILLVWNKHDTL